MQMKQVMNHNKNNGLLNMIRRTDPMITQWEYMLFLMLQKLFLIMVSYVPLVHRLRFG